MAARLLEDTNFVVVQQLPQPNPEYAVYDVSDPNQLPVFVAEVGIPTTNPNFPYGNEVEPD